MENKKCLKRHTTACAHAALARPPGSPMGAQKPQQNQQATHPDPSIHPDI